MRIFKVSTEWPREHTANWANYYVLARTCEEAIKKAEKRMSGRERVIEVKLLGEEG